ncbi:MAG: hypothetical protein AABZ74_10865 [Cyanobacteriota bacterium]
MLLRPFLVTIVSFLITVTLLDYIKDKNILNQDKSLKISKYSNSKNKYLKDISFNSKKELNRIFKTNKIQNILSLSFSNDDFIQDYKINETKDKLFLLVSRNNTYKLEMIDIIKKNTTNILKKTFPKENVSWEEWFYRNNHFKDFKEIEDKLSVYFFKMKEEVFFIDKNSGKILKSITNYEKESIKFSNDYKKVFYLRKDAKNLTVKFYCLDLVSFEEKTIFSKKFDTKLLIKDPNLEYFFKEDFHFRMSNIKLFENIEKNEIFIFALDELKIIDNKTFNIKKSILLKNTKTNKDLFSVKVIDIDNKNNRVLIGRQGYDIDILELNSSLKYTFYEDKDFRFNLGNVKVEFSKDSKYVLQVGDDDNTDLFDFKTKKILDSFTTWYGYSEISKDSKTIIYSGNIYDDKEKCNRDIAFCTVYYDIKTKKKKIITKIVKKNDGIIKLRNNKGIFTKTIGNKSYKTTDTFINYDIVNFFIKDREKTYPIFINKKTNSIMTNNALYSPDIPTSEAINVSKTGKYFFVLYKDIDLSNNSVKTNFDFFSVH